MRRSYLIYSAVAVPVTPSVPDDEIEELSKCVKLGLEAKVKEMEADLARDFPYDLKVKVID